jgi:perosamine synthetase
MIPIAKPLIGNEEKKAVLNTMDSGMIACGPITEQFEKNFADFVDTKYALATTSGTTALHLALLALDVSFGDEVILPSFSFVASANSILFCNATPVFCDVDQNTCTIDTQKLKSLITDKTKAIMPVHLYGQPADMNPILKIAKDHDLYVIGDAAQAHGAQYDEKKIGSFGDCECFSFYPTKNMTTGEGGIITTNDLELYERLNSIRNHGREQTKWGYDHGRLGYNYRMTDISASIGLEQLKKLPYFNMKRQQNAAYLDEKLGNVEEIKIPYVLENATHVYHQYTIKCNNRKTVIQNLKKNEVGYGIYYPKPLHLFNHLKKYSHNDLKISEKLADKVLSLPVHPALDTSDLKKIVSCF